MTRLAFLTVPLLLVALDRADAHAHLTHAQPAAGATVATPHELTLDFSEGVVPRFCKVTVTDAAGRPVSAGRPAKGSGAAALVVALPDTLPAGAYKVEWHAVSVDTHRTQGSFTFIVAP